MDGSIGSKLVGLIDELRQWYQDHTAQPPAQSFPRGLSYGSRYPADNPPAPAGAGSARTLQLLESASVVLNGSGNGTAKITPPGPRNGGLSWTVEALAVSVQPAPGNMAIILEAQASAYLSYGILPSGADPNSFIGQTLTGSHGDTCGMGQTVSPGDWIYVIWTGGDAGATATFRLSGTINPPGS